MPKRVSQDFDGGLHRGDHGGADLWRLCGRVRTYEGRVLQKVVDAALVAVGVVVAGQALQALVQRLDDLQHRLGDAVGHTAPGEHIDALLRAGNLVAHAVSLLVQQALRDVELHDTARAESVATAAEDVRRLVLTKIYSVGWGERKGLRVGVVFPSTLTCIASSVGTCVAYSQARPVG